MKLLRMILLIALGIGVFACQSPQDIATGQTAYTVQIDWHDAQQEIDGFGLSAAFRQADNLMAYPEPQRTEILDLLFDQETGAGFSIVRNIIGDGGTWGNAIDGPSPTIRPTEDGDYVWTGDEDQIWFMHEAATRGTTRFISTAWSPPAWMKSNGSVINGGELLPDYYQAYADYLANYCNGYAEQHGIEIYAISPANEPDFSAGYSSALWSGYTFRDFIGQYLAPTFDELNVQCKVIVGETSGFRENIVNPVLQDEAAAARVDIVAAHAYDGGVTEFRRTLRAGKHLWQTEVSDFGPTDPGMDSGLRWAKMLHQHMTISQTNAWFYWWGITYKDDEEALINLDIPNADFLVNKRLWTLGNTTRFVRPGWVRITTTPAAQDGDLFVAAYKDPATAEFAIVAINDSDNDLIVDLALEGFTTTSVTPYRTSETEDLAELPALPVDGTTLEVTLAARSVTTFAGTEQAQP